MEDADFKHRFHLIQTEIEATASLFKDAKIDLTSAIDSIKIEVEMLKTLHGALSSRVRQDLCGAPGRSNPGDGICPRVAGRGTDAETMKQGDLWQIRQRGLRSATACPSIR